MRSIFLLFSLLLLSQVSLQAQAGGPIPDAPQCRISDLKVCVTHVAQDELGIVSSPLRTRAVDLLWIVPFGVATAVTLHNDTNTIRALGVDPQREDQFSKISTYGGLYAPFAASAAGYFAGEYTHNDQLQETAVLAAEAMADAGILDEGLKYALDREYPKLDNARGGFWPHGPKGWPNNPSMPSEHSMNIWAFAHVVGGQYNGIATRAIVYSLATTVSVSRVIARDHFPSDVLVGSTFGYLVGGYVLNHRSREHASHFMLSAVQTAHGKGAELSYSFAR